MQILFKCVPCLPSFLKLLINPHVLLTFGQVQNPLRLPHKMTIERPKVVSECGVLSHVDFEMCFAPQRRALFQHLNFQKWSDTEAFLPFSLRNVQLPKVLRTWCVLYILASKRASGHNCVHFFDISTSKSAPNVRCFELFHLQICFAPRRRATFHLSPGQLAPHPPL